MTMTITLATMPSPIGPLTIATNERGQVCALEIGSRASRLPARLAESHGPHDRATGPVPDAIADALRRYFAGDLAAIDAIEVATPGTPLQRQVWAALRRIPAGSTTSYGELARQLGQADPRAAIEVGAANGANPIAIVVPCHRVIAKGGHLRGYAWGLHRKAWLLEHEGVLTPEAAQASPVSARLPGF